MGTPEFAVPSLQALIKTQNVVGVVTQPDRLAGRGQELRPSPVKLVAQEAGVPVYQPRSLRPLESAEPIRAWQPEAIIVAAFGQILRPHVLQLPPKGCFNVHASLLPRWRGASPIQHAIMAGDEWTGITLMQMDEGLDTGSILVQREVRIEDQDTSATLHDRLALLGAEMLTAHLTDILNGCVLAHSQDESLATYAPMFSKEAGHVQWARGSLELDRLIRAMTPWPGATTTWDGQLLKLLRAHPQEQGPVRGLPGQVFQEGEQLLVQTGEGWLVIDRLQLAGKKALDAMEFLRGRPDLLGAILDA